MEPTTAEVSMTNAFLLKGITYLPSYQIENRYVSPGFGLTHWQTFSALDLMALGATPQTIALWPRAWGKK